MAFTEKSFYIILILVLATLAVFLPIIIIQTGEKPRPYIYLSDRPNGDTGPVQTHMSDYDTKYPKLEELNAYLDDFVTYRGAIYSVEKIGDSPVYEIILQKKPCDAIILVVSGIFTNDWESVLTTLKVMNRFYLDVKRTDKLLDKFSFHFLPLMNPDGYQFSMSLPIHHNWANSYQGYINDKPKGQPIVFTYNTSEDTKESKFFKNYFTEKGNQIQAAFFLYTPKGYPFRAKEFTIPRQYLENNTEKEAFIDSLGWAITRYCPGLWFKIEQEIYTGRIDQWIVNQTRPNPILVGNFHAYFKPGPSETLRYRIKELGHNVHFVITRILEILAPSP